MLSQRLVWTCLLSLGLASALQAGPPDKRETKRLVRELQTAFADQDWRTVGERIESLGECEDPKVWALMGRAVERAPLDRQLESSLARAAAQATHKRVVAAVLKLARKSPNPYVRRALVPTLIRHERWKDLTKALGDKDEQVAALAAWGLLDHRVEMGVKPMIDHLRKVEKKRAGIWDVLQGGLRRLLGTRCASADAFLERWESVQAAGGLGTVKPLAEKKPGAAPPAGAPTLFGRELLCTRVVFVLDVSGFMARIDALQRAPKGAAVRLPSRLERATKLVNDALAQLPGEVKVNVVAFASRVKTWKPPARPRFKAALTPLDKANRRSVLEFVKSFTPHGVCTLDRALRCAFEVEGTRCVYLLGSGRATYDGTTPVPLGEMLDVLKEVQPAHVTLHTLAFKGSDTTLYEALAKAGGGTYSEIE